jgi:hypothetical protein
MPTAGRAPMTVDFAGDPGSLRIVRNQKTEKQKSRNGRDLWRMLLLIVGVIAVVQELRKSPEVRTWHGKVGDLIPYDFRKPTVERFRQTYWNPDGPFLAGKAFGVGWAPNFGAVKRLFGT